MRAALVGREASPFLAMQKTKSMNKESFQTHVWQQVMNQWHPPCVVVAQVQTAGHLTTCIYRHLSSAFETLARFAQRPNSTVTVFFMHLTHIPRALSLAEPVMQWRGDKVSLAEDIGKRVTAAALGPVSALSVAAKTALWHSLTPAMFVRFASSDVPGVTVRDGLYRVHRGGVLILVTDTIVYASLPTQTAERPPVIAVTVPDSLPGQPPTTWIIPESRFENAPFIAKHTKAVVPIEFEGCLDAAQMVPVTLF